MMIQRIFDDYVEQSCKDIIFFTANTCMVIPRINISVDAAIMQAYTNMFAVYY
jgi:hypothetical protein